MTAANHALTGAAIAAFVRQPLLALPIALASHFACDALPHFGVDMKFGSALMYRWLIIDGLVTVMFAVALLLIGVEAPWLLALCGFVAMSPDFMWLYHGLKKSKRKNYGFLTRIHTNIQWFQKPVGLLFEFAWALVCFIVILYGSKV